MELIKSAKQKFANSNMDCLRFDKLLWWFGKHPECFSGEEAAILDKAIQKNLNMFNETNFNEYKSLVIELHKYYEKNGYGC